MRKCLLRILFEPCTALYDEKGLIQRKPFNTRKISLYKVSLICHSHDVTKFIFQNCLKVLNGTIEKSKLELFLYCIDRIQDYAARKWISLSLLGNDEHSAKTQHKLSMP